MAVEFYWGKSVLQLSMFPKSLVMVSLNVNTVNILLTYFSVPSLRKRIRICCSSVTYTYIFCF